MARFADIFTALASGAARGYRAGQELQRQILEAKRKALMEERDAATKERLATSQMALESATADERRAGAAKVTQGTQEATRASERDLTPIAPSGVIGQDINSLGIPQPTMGDFRNPGIAGLLERLTGERGATSRENLGNRARIDNPTVFGGSRREYLNPEDDALFKLAERLHQKVPEFIAFDPVRSAAWTAEQDKRTEKILSRSPRIRALLYSDSTAVDNPFSGVKVK
jgi:hypothetical protein